MSLIDIRFCSVNHLSTKIGPTVQRDGISSRSSTKQASPRWADRLEAGISMKDLTAPPVIFEAF
jgi:hypothetical protein